MLAEMDEEFGVGELVKESIKEEKNKVSPQLMCLHVHISICLCYMLTRISHVHVYEYSLHVNVCVCVCVCVILSLLTGLHLEGPEWTYGGAQH